MEISSIMEGNLNSILQSVNVSVMRKAISADAQSMGTLLEGLEAANPVAPPGYQLYTHV